MTTNLANLDRKCQKEVERYAWENVRDKWLDVYRELAGR